MIKNISDPKTGHLAQYCAFKADKFSNNLHTKLLKHKGIAECGFQWAFWMCTYRWAEADACVLVFHFLFLSENLVTGYVKSRPNCFPLLEYTLMFTADMYPNMWIISSVSVEILTFYHTIHNEIACDEWIVYGWYEVLTQKLSLS